MKIQYFALAGAAYAQMPNGRSLTPKGLMKLQKLLTEGVAAVTMNPLTDYGCWCYFGAKHTQGRGPALDEYDAACKQLSRGYECAMMDEPACVPWEASYQPDFMTQAFALYGAASNPATIPQTCAQNTDECARIACIIEGTFLARVYNADDDPNVQTTLAYKQANGFDNKDQNNCPVSGGRGDAEDACCGEYPDRRPYRFKTGERECCDKGGIYTVYNSGLFDCCPDGSIQASC